MTMPEFRQISFDANELEAIRLACERQAEAEDGALDESASEDLDRVVMQVVKTDDMLLIKQTVRIFWPGLNILTVCLIKSISSVFTSCMTTLSRSWEAD